MTAALRPDTDAPLILCIEDEAALRRDLAEELQDAGYRVIEAVDGEDALLQLEAVRPDLILCDISMPGMDGYELLRRLQTSRKDYAETPFIFLTALADRRQVVEGKRMGADDYLTKPVDFDLMLATVQARLRQITRIREHPRRANNLAALTSNKLTNDPGMAAVLDLISTGIILIDSKQEATFTNQAARSLAALCPELRAALDQASRASGRKASLSTWLSEMLDQLEEGGASSFNLPYDDHQHSLMMVGCKLAACEEGGLALALFITDLAGAPAPSPDVLASLFGFTPAECLVAGALATGDSPAKIAVTLGIAQTTVAFHMRNIFQKTGVSRQASLVALLLTSPASML